MAHRHKNQNALEALKQTCRAEGLKATPQRIEILNIISSAKNHPSAEDVYRQVNVRMPGISFDTVYRTLSTLEERKLISRVHHLDDKTRYDPNTSEHHHFVCLSCKNIFDFEWPDFASLKLPNGIPGFGRIERKYVEVRGLCSKCCKHA
jgi:Fur family transcriptional regulator, peroxide stress response regulator